VESKENLAQRLSALTARSLAEQAHNVERLHDLLQKVARSELPQAALFQGYKGFVRDSVPAYFRQVAELGLEFLHSLVAINERLNEALFEHLLGARPAATVGPRQQTAAGGRPRLTVAMAGTSGETASASVLVENRRGERVEVSFLISDFLAADGAEPFRAPLLLEPSQFRLDPGQEQAVAFRLPLLPELFTPGTRHEAIVVVRGSEEQEIHLIVEVAAAAPPAAEPTVRPVVNAAVKRVGKRADPPPPLRLAPVSPPARRRAAAKVAAVAQQPPRTAKKAASTVGRVKSRKGTGSPATSLRSSPPRRKR